VQSTEEGLRDIYIWRDQLQVLLGKGGAAELRKRGINAARIMALSQYSFDKMTGVLMHAPTLPHYCVKGVPCDDRGKPLSITETREQRTESMVVLPKVLQQDVCATSGTTPEAALTRSGMIW
jgi:hypothetical protein